jgi:cyanobactin biosynthesis protein (PatB/AcyB/McaB family)
VSLPPQAPPVRRPHLVEPHRAVEVDRGDTHQLLRVRMYLLHGANFNDPGPWVTPDYYRMRASVASAEPGAPEARARRGPWAAGW